MNNSKCKKEKKEKFNKAQLEVCPGVKRYGSYIKLEWRTGKAEI